MNGQVGLKTVVDRLISLSAWISCTLQDDLADSRQELLFAAQRLHDDALLVRLLYTMHDCVFCSACTGEIQA